MVAAEVLLDRHDLRRQQSPVGEHERLHDARDPAIAIAKRMGGDDVEMGHGGTDGDMSIHVAVLEPVDDLAHERRHLVGGRSEVRRRSPARAGDLDTAAPVPARILLPLEVTGIEVQVEDDAIDPPEDRVVGHDADMIHGAGVARQSHAVGVVRVRPLVSAGDCDRLLGGDMEALDLDRALRRGRAPLAAQAPEPWAGGAGLIAKTPAQLIERVARAANAVRSARNDGVYEQPAQHPGRHPDQAVQD
jgi:hypothetical protein